MKKYSEPKIEIIDFETEVILGGDNEISAGLIGNSLGGILDENGEPVEDFGN